MAKYKLVSDDQEKALKKVIAQKKLLNDWTSGVSSEKINLLEGASVVDPQGNVISQSTQLPETPLQGKLSETDYQELLSELDSSQDLEFEEVPEEGLTSSDKVKLGGSAVTSAMMGANAQTESQAIVSGVSAGLSTAAIAGGPVGWAVGAGVALLGIASARKAKKEQERAERKAEAERKRAEELRLLETHNQRRANAINQLAGAFRR